MTARLGSILLTGVVMAIASALVDNPGARADDALRLVTFGPRAQQFEGDHDFRQFVHISVPEGSGQLYLCLFDADISGDHDEPLRGFNTETRFSLYGEGGVPRLFRDEGGVVQEVIEGEPLGTATFGFDEAANGQWVTLFPLNAAEGAPDGDRRGFVLAVEDLWGRRQRLRGLCSRSDTENRKPGDVRLYSFAPTFQIAEEGEYSELRFTVPQGADALVVENFDAAGAGISYAGRSFSAPLTASERSKWRRDRVARRPGEPGRAGSILMSGGAESPNDATVVVNIPGDGPADEHRPIAVDLPVRVVAANTRPFSYFRIDQLSCGEMQFDASDAFDGNGDSLTYRWYFDGSDEADEGALVTRQFARAGDQRGRLELFDSSRVVANGRVVDFSFHVKLPPEARFDIPGLSPKVPKSS